MTEPGQIQRDDASTTGERRPDGEPRRERSPQAVHEDQGRPLPAEVGVVKRLSGEVDRSRESWVVPALADHLPHVADDEQLVWQFPQVSQRLDLIGWGEELVVSVETPMHQFQ